MEIRDWYSVIHEESGAKPGQLVEHRGYIQVDQDGQVRYLVRWPREGEFVLGFIRKDNLLTELPPDAWLADI